MKNMKQLIINMYLYYTDPYNTMCRENSVYDEYSHEARLLAKCESRQEIVEAFDCQFGGINHINDKIVLDIFRIISI